MTAPTDRERGDIVLGWLTKVVVTLAVLGVIAFDAISIGTTRMSLADQGQTAAMHASTVWEHTKDIQQAYEAAVDSARESNALNVVDADSFRGDPDGTVHLTLRRTAATLVVERIGPIRRWAAMSAQAEARDVS